MNTQATMQICRIAFIGAGNMTRGVIGGLLQSGVDRSMISVADPMPAALDAVRESFGVAVSSHNPEVIRDAQVVILAVKPQDMRDMTLAVQPAIGAHGPLVISVAAGIPIAALARWLRGHRRIVRTMPNRPALLGCGVTALFAEAVVGEPDRSLAQRVLATVGTTVWLEREEQMDAVTAVSGSGPAYFFLLIELLEAAACECGLPPDVARTLSIETAYGAGCLARRRDAEPVLLRAQVTSKGGTTEAALRELESADLRGIVSRAVGAAMRRSREIADQSGR